MSQQRSTTLPPGFKSRSLLAAGAALLLLIILGAWSQLTLQKEIETRLESELTTLLKSQRATITSWLENQQQLVGALAASPTIKQASQEQTETTVATAQTLLNSLAKRFGYEHYGIADRRSGRLLLSDAGHKAIDGLNETARNAIDKAWDSGELTTTPLPAGTWGKSISLLAIAPIAHDSQQHVLVLAYDPKKTFSTGFTIARLGETGETYAFDGKGYMLTQSRFTDQLHELNLLPQETNSTILQLRLVVPNAGEQEPYTRAVASGIAMGQSQDPKIVVDTDGFQDYRDVTVIGAWCWLPGLGFGVTTEQDYAEAYAPLQVLQMLFGVLFLLLFAVTVGLFIIGRRQALVSHKLSKAEAQAEELGQYQIEGKIGEGGMGTVFRARHKLMRRPTAVKMIKPDEADEEGLLRFEREVKLCCQLSHPNTIAIYDYGRTDDGQFYYAMEMLVGMDLETIIEETGNMPASRVIKILRQACGSLAEAHDMGLIHRDIKPANIFLCFRGGEYDVVKVLDFGLVKSMDGGNNLTAADVICGTPSYMCPEIITQEDNIDGRSDLYSLACVAYYLLSGEPVFEKGGVMDTIMAHRDEEPPSLSSRGVTVPPDLEDLLLRCLAKDPKDRPADAWALDAELAACSGAEDWDRALAMQWWKKHGGKQVRSATDSKAKYSMSIKLESRGTN